MPGNIPVCWGKAFNPEGAPPAAVAEAPAAEGGAAPANPRKRFLLYIEKTEEEKAARRAREEKGNKGKGRKAGQQ